MKQQERLYASALLGGGIGAGLWVLHGVSRVLGIQRLFVYAAGGTAIAFVVDLLTTPQEQ